MGAAMAGLVMDVQRFSIHDGPGIRTAIFFKGCPLACKWCQNPEGLSPRPQLAHRADKCAKCGACAAACPGKALKKHPRATYSMRKCKVGEGCTGCVDVCPSRALEIVGKAYTVEELLEVVSSDKHYFDNSGGGVTASGGEPTMQWPFVHAFLLACKEKGINTTLQTCGHFMPGIIDDIIDSCDLVFYDLKHVDTNLHQALTGKSNDMILDNLVALKTALGSEERLVVRMPLVPGMNDSPSHLGQVDDWLHANGLERLVLLPYHALYVEKFNRLFLDRPGAEIPCPSASNVLSAKASFTKARIITGGISPR